MVYEKVNAPEPYACYGRSGEHDCVPITGHHARRILHGVLNVQNGEVLLAFHPGLGPGNPSGFPPKSRGVVRQLLTHQGTVLSTDFLKRMFPAEIPITY